MEWNFNVTGPVRADVQLAAGRVDVQLAPGISEAKVRMEPMSSKHADRAEAAIGDAVVELHGSDLIVHVRERWRSSDIAMWLELPDNSGLTASVASADVAVSGGTLSNADIKTASGDVRLGDVAGHVSTASASGELSAGNIGGELSAATASGDVRVRSLRAAAKVRSASADVEIGSLEEGTTELSIATASGDVSIGSATRGNVKVNTASGDVTVGVGEGVGAWLDLTTMSGETNCSLPGEVQSAASAQLSLTCRTMSGDITVRRAPAMA